MTSLSALEHLAPEGILGVGQESKAALEPGQSEWRKCDKLARGVLRISVKVQGSG